MATNQPRDRERAGYLGDQANDGARTGVHADTGKPQAEHSQYGMVREGSAAARGLSERQIRGVEPQPGHQDADQAEATPTDGKPRPGL